MANKTFDPMKAPLSEVLDWLAERDGWRIDRSVQPPSIPLWTRTKWDATAGAGVLTTNIQTNDDGEVVTGNPITLDRLAGMLPETWCWEQIQGFSWGCWYAEAREDRDFKDGSMDEIDREIASWPRVWFEDAPTELEARARVVAAVLMRP